FIPLANDYPEDRVKYIHENSDADWVISENNLKNSVNVKTLLTESNDETNPKININSDDLAYMIYTSGTTGKPKGVMVTNENVANLFANTDNNYVYNLFKTLNTLLSISTVSFDASLIELLGSFLTGRTLIFANDQESKDIFELIDLIKKTKPDYMGTTPSRLLQYMEFDGFNEQLANFKIMHVGGEKFPKELASKLAHYNVQAYNSYGPTETTMESNLTLVEPGKPVSVGGGLYNYITDVRDIDSKLLPDGVMGELYIGGKGVTKGYYKNDEKTRNSYTQIGQTNYYRSGDYAIRKDDDIYIMGRMDNQIKLRGLRIEPEEISSVIATYDSIIKAVTVIKKINDMDHLCAYYTANCEIDVEKLRNYMSKKLTDYMIPTAFMQLDKLPQTPNGKTDIKRLPEPEIDIGNYIPPRDETEEKLWDIISNILGTTSFGVDSDLFSIGLTSLTMMQVVSDIYDNFNTQVMLTDLMKNRTIENIKTLIKEDDNERADKQERYPLTPNQLG
ncbi:MAG: non-ribosomal peptide synthetase, partial [Methanosphaera sp.]|nr:non-ribosomal peptide synthetase [Methanosphaera sp.]